MDRDKIERGGIAIVRVYSADMALQHALQARTRPTVDRIEKLARDFHEPAVEITQLVRSSTTKEFSAMLDDAMRRLGVPRSRKTVLAERFGAALNSGRTAVLELQALESAITTAKNRASRDA